MATFSFNYDDTATAELDGFTLQARTTHDQENAAPWTNEDGHGPVREARGSTDFRMSPAKRPGELVLIEDRNWAYFYDYAEACRIALKDGWDAEPYNKDGRETPRQQAAKAARADFERLRDWATGDWSYVGVIVTASRNGIELGHASLWGIESDAGDYLQEVAEELIPEALEDARATLARLCDCQELAA